jgi:hypothetical protein
MSEPDQTAPGHLPDDAPSGSSSAWRGVVWFGVLAALAIWVAVGRVSTYRGQGLRGSARVWDVWRTIRHDLPLPGPAVIAILLLALGGCAWLLWLALAFADESASGTTAPGPPGWAIGALIPLGIVFVALVLWADPRDDVTAESLRNQTGIQPTLIPTACATSIDRAAALRSGDLKAGRAERAAGTGCHQAIATLWPTESTTWPTQAALWSTVEAAAR